MDGEVKYIGFMTRFPPDVHREVKQAASEDDRSLNGQVVALIRLALAQRKAQLAQEPRQ